MRTIIVYDTSGGVFNRLREMELGLPLWRVTDPQRLEKADGAELAIVATYGAVPWATLTACATTHRTLVLAARYVPADASEAIERGIDGYLDAGMDADALRRAIVGAAGGEPAYARRALGAWMLTVRDCSRAHRNVAALTTRQQEIVALIAEGLADKEIAETLGIATATAQKHVTNILERLHVPNRAAAAASVCGRLLKRKDAAVDAVATGAAARPPCDPAASAGTKPRPAERQRTMHLLARPA